MPIHVYIYHYLYACAFRYTCTYALKVRLVFPLQCGVDVGPFVSPEEVLARLLQVGLFDKAVDTALHFELPLDSIFEALASRYTQASPCISCHYIFLLSIFCIIIFMH